jgi:tetratricopeptide (TPR) repeat protein
VRSFEWRARAESVFFAGPGLQARPAAEVETDSMRFSLVIAVVFACCFWAAPQTRAQQQNKPPASPANGNPPAAQQPDRTQQQSNQNPFPADTNDVPVMPTKTPPDLPAAAGDEGARVPMPDEDVDPVRTPEGESAQEQGNGGSASSLAGLGDLLPDADDETNTQPDRRGRKAQKPVPEHHESAAEDENVGKYYLDNKDWKAALSRFESALVLDPDNPDVYWGLAEAERHLGNFAGARANYLKVTEYDPDSKHGKDARKALEDPEIANARPAPSAAPAPSQ